MSTSGSKNWRHNLKKHQRWKRSLPNSIFRNLFTNPFQVVTSSHLYSAASGFPSFILALIFICSYSHKRKSKHFKVKIITFLLTPLRGFLNTNLYGRLNSVPLKLQGLLGT